MAHFATTASLYPFFAAARTAIAARREAYDRECAEYAEQGLAPRYCIHGTNLWVEWDCACGACEGDDRSDLQIARDMAHEWTHELGWLLDTRDQLSWMGAAASPLAYNALELALREINEVFITRLREILGD